MDRQFEIKDTYRLDDLQNGGLKIWQDTSEFCFGMDAVLLSDFAARRMRKKDISADLCTGNGIVPILVYARVENLNMTAVEITPSTYELAKYNMLFNGIDDKVTVINEDVKVYAKENINKLDVITVNPPYIPLNSGLQSKKDTISTARHEIALTLDELLRSCKMLLKDKGRVYMVHRANRAAETINLMYKHRITPKTIRFIQPKESEEANLFLIEGVKNAGDWLKVLPALVVYDENGNYTKEILEIYKGEKNNERRSD